MVNLQIIYKNKSNFNRTVEQKGRRRDILVIIFVEGYSHVE